MEIDDDLLISYLLGEAPPELAKQVTNWINANQANKERYNQFKLIWEASRNVSYDGVLNPQASLERLKEKVARRNEKAKIVPLERKNNWLYVAATILFFAGCGLFYFYQRNFSEIELVTKNEVRIDTLSDGSIVTLNKASILKYPIRFKGNRRSINLAQGEAFFDVAKNKAMPFVISTGGTTIRVVGTSFNVKSKPDEVEVIVETGIVLVTRNGNTITLRPGEKVLVSQKSSLFRKEKNPDQLYNYYRSKEFIANNTPLWRLVEVLNDAYNSKIVIGRKELSDLPLNTTFNDQSLDNILMIICRTFGATLERKEGLIIIK